MEKERPSTLKQISEKYMRKCPKSNKKIITKINSPMIDDKSNKINKKK